MKTRETRKAGRKGLAALAAVFLFAGVVLASSVQGVREVSYDKLTDTGIKPKVQKVALDPTRGWVGSDVFVKAGDLVGITAEGLIDPGVRLMRGPDGAGRDLVKEMTHNCAYMELLARVGDGAPFCVGSASTFEIIEGGHISFHVNELDTLRFDDSGHFDISIQWVSPKEQESKTPALTAVMDLVPMNISERDCAVITAALRGHLAATGKYTLIDQGQVDQTVRNMHIQKAELANPRTAARVGAAVGANQVIIGQVGKIGSSYSVTLQRVNGKSGQVENTVVEVYECKLGELPAKIAAAAKKL